jgi:hypothetical protein
MSKLDETMKALLTEIRNRSNERDTTMARNLAEAYHFLACTKVLVPWSPTKVETSELNARLA